MGRLIDADKLKAHYAWWEKSNAVAQEYKAVFDTIIDLQPTFDPTPATCFGCNCPKMEKLEAEPIKHGRWIEVQRINPTDRMAICECTNCGNTIWVYDGHRTWNYCPNCGADMRGGEK